MDSDTIVKHRNAIIRHTTTVEAGYVDHPKDLGKVTNHGITYATSREPLYAPLWEKYNWNGDMKTLPLEMAYEMYYIGWWQRLWLDRIVTLSVKLAERLFDFSVNAGRGNAVTALQRILNVSNKAGTLYPNLVVDGGMGNKTYQALEAHLKMTGKDSTDRLVMLMFSMQNYHYLDISEKRANEDNEAFTNGWFNRTYNDFKEYASAQFAKK